MCVCVCVCVAQSLSHVQLFAIPWTIARQAPLWNSPSKNTGGVAMPFSRRAS